MDSGARRLPGRWRRPTRRTAVVRPAMVAKYQSGYENDLREWADTAALVRVEWAA